MGEQAKSFFFPLCFLCLFMVFWINVVVIIIIFFFARVAFVVWTMDFLCLGF